MVWVPGIEDEEDMGFGSESRRPGDHSQEVLDPGQEHQIRHHKSRGAVSGREVTQTHHAPQGSWTDDPNPGTRTGGDWTWWSQSETDKTPGPETHDSKAGSLSSSGWTSAATAANSHSNNITFPSIALESNSNQTTHHNTSWGQSVFNFTEAYSNHSTFTSSLTDGGRGSAVYPHNVPSVSEYGAQFHSSEPGYYLTSGGEHTQHVPTSSLYNLYSVSTNNTNSSLLYNISLDGAIMGNNTGSPWQKPVIEVTVLEIVIAVVLSGFILAIIVGNMFVILSVALFRDMRTLTNGLIVSLASADLLVAIIVLPISLYHEIIGSWTLGPYVCDFWITSDVFCCTASILNIVVIAVDRYWLITKNVRYTHNRTFPRQRAVVIMCFVAWVLSGIISSSPLFGWQEGNEDMDPYMCIISQDLGYTVFSTFGAFWFPLMVILLVYMKIFKIARKRAKTRARAQAIHPSMNSTVLSEANGKPSRYSRPSKSDSNSPQASPKLGRDREREQRHRRRVSSSHSKRSQRGRIRSSARTLGLIIGGFVFCWLPFFLLATVLPFCAACQVPPYVMSIVLWLGYSNSLLNPAIYAIWDKNFRRSFKRLATCSVRWSHVL